VKWTYCGGATAILGRLIAKGTGEKLHDYARRVRTCFSTLLPLTENSPTPEFGE